LSEFCGASATVFCLKKNRKEKSGTLKVVLMISVILSCSKDHEYTLNLLGVFSFACGYVDGQSFLPPILRQY
jgi:hypothetical protein